MNEATILPFRVVSNYVCGICQQVEGASRYDKHPVRISVPVQRSVWKAEQAMEVADEHGRVIPAMVKPFLKWLDGSVRSYEVWLPLNLARKAEKSFTLRRPTGVKPDVLPVASLDVPTRFNVSVLLQDGSRISQQVEFPLPEHTSDFWVDQAEQEFTIAQPDNQPAFYGAITRRLWSWYAGGDFAIRLINHLPGENTPVRAVRLELELPVKPTRHLIRQTCIMVDHPRLIESSNPLTVVADAGGVRVTDPAQLHENAADYPVYEVEGLTTVSNWIAAGDGEATWLLVMPEAAQRFPKAWRFEGSRVVIDLHPPDASPLDWQRGMALFQRFQLVKLPAGATAAECEDVGWSWLRKPIVKVDADQYRAGGWRIPFRFEPARFPRTEIQYRQTYGFSWRRGTFDWGDDSFDGLSARLASLQPDQRWRTVMRNNEYDFIASSAKEFARTGQQAVFEKCRQAAEHLMHTDFVAVSDDPWREGGVPAHCIMHTRGAAYPSHMWIEGLSLYYQLTGEPYALQVARRIGDFFLKYLDQRWEVLNGTAREGGWALIAITAIYDLTGDPRYLRGLEKLVDFYLTHSPTSFYPYDAVFTIGVALIGLDRARHFHRDNEVKNFMLNVMDWCIDHRRTPDGLFDYHFDSEVEGVYYVQSKLPDAINTCYLLSGDEKYLRVAWRQYQAAQHVPLTVQEWGRYESGYAAAAHLSWMGCLASFAEKGWLDTMQYSEPWRASAVK